MPSISSLDPSCPVRPSVTSVGVVVPTHNSARTIGACLKSLRAQTVACQIVVVDNHSSDSTVRIARPLADHILILGPERSAQRNAGARALRCDWLGFIDSDMILNPKVVANIIAVSQLGAVSIVIPERTIGTGFWAAVRTFERGFYMDDQNLEAARFFRNDVFARLGGFDETLTGPEDWDLAARARALGPVGRTTAEVVHLEQGLTLREACRKKAYYAPGLSAYRAKYGTAHFVRHLNRRYIRQPWRLVFPHPLLGAGLLVLKFSELAMVCRVLIFPPGQLARVRSARDAPTRNEGP